MTFPFFKTHCVHHRTHCGDQNSATQCHIHTSPYIFTALPEGVHPYNTGWTFSKTSKTSGEETHQSDWPLAQKHSQPHSTQLQTPGNACKGNPAHLLWGFVNYAHRNMFTLPLKFDIVPAGSTSLNWSRFWVCECLPQTTFNYISSLFFFVEKS